MEIFVLNFVVIAFSTYPNHFRNNRNESKLTENETELYNTMVFMVWKHICT
jgi:hypothetical protein